MFRLFRVEDARALLILAIPVFLAQLAQMSMGFVDAVVAGRASATDMASVAVASSFWIPTTLFGQGILMAITPLVAQARGAGAHEGLGLYLRQGVWLALFISVCLMLALFGASLLLPSFSGIEGDLSRKTALYLRFILCGVPGLMLYCVFRAFLEGHGRTRPAMMAGFIGLLLHIPANFIFVFGLFGFPALGGPGCGLASAIVCWVMAVIMFFSVRQASPHSIRSIRIGALRKSVAVRILRIGLPGACALLIETSSFLLIALLIAPLGAVVVAGHQVALNVSGLLFVIPLSIGSATTIRVGVCLGEGDLLHARRTHRTAIGLILLLAMLSASGLLLFRNSLAMVYSKEVAVISLAAMLLIFAAIYQFSDAVQLVTVSALRGYNDTRAIFAITFISYWLVSFPLGCALALTSWLTPAPLGAAGFWISLIVGLSCAALLSTIRLKSLEKLSPEAIQAKINR